MGFTVGGRVKVHGLTEKANRKFNKKIKPIWSTLKSSNKRGRPPKKMNILKTGLKTILKTGWGPLFGKFQVDYEAKFQVSWKIPSPKKDMFLDMEKDMFLETFLGGAQPPFVAGF